MQWFCLDHVGQVGLAQINLLIMFKHHSKVNCPLTFLLSNYKQEGFHIRLFSKSNSIAFLAIYFRLEISTNLFHKFGIRDSLWWKQMSHTTSILCQINMGVREIIK